MAMRRLIIEQATEYSKDTPAYVCVDVDDTTPIGSLVSTLAARFGYPLVDSFGLPVTYQLCSIPDRKPLPTTGRFADARFPSGCHFVLETEAAHYETVPMQKEVDLPISFRQRQPTPSRFSRRSLITGGGVLALVGLLGLGTGVTTALAPHVLSRYAATTSSPKAGPTVSMRLALTQQAVFSRHQRLVRTVAWSPDGTRLASGGNDALAFIWQLDGTVLHMLQFNDQVRGLAWSPDGMQLVGGAGLTISFFDAHMGILLAERAGLHMAPVTALAWTQTMAPLAVSAGEDNQAIVWDGKTHQPRVTFRQHTAPIEALSTLAAVVATASQGGLVRVWSALTGLELHGYFSDTTQSLRSAAFSSWGQLAIGGDDGIVRLWNDGRACVQQTAFVFGTRCVDTPRHLQGHTRPVRAVAFSPDGTLLATGGDDSKLTLWSVQDLTPILTQTLQEAITAVAWSASQQFLAVAAGQHVIVWQIHHE